MKYYLLKIFLIIISIGYWLVASPVAYAQSNIQLSAASTNLNINKKFEVTITVSSNANTIGTDAVISYDPKFLRLESVTPGTIYPNYSNVTGQTNSGKITIIAVSDFSSGITPSGVFATLTFTPLVPGTTEVSLDFAPNATNLTGIIPFEGNTPNLLTTAPAPLSLTINDSPLAQIAQSSNNLRLPITIGVIISVAIVSFLLIRRKPKSAPNLPPLSNQVPTGTWPTPPPTIPPAVAPQQPPAESSQIPA